VGWGDLTNGGCGEMVLGFLVGNYKTIGEIIMIGIFAALMQMISVFYIGYYWCSAWLYWVIKSPGFSGLSIICEDGETEVELLEEDVGGYKSAF
jgi:hypothetical protein